MSDPVLDLILLLEDNLALVATDCFDDHISYGTDVSAGWKVPRRSTDVSDGSKADIKIKLRGYPLYLRNRTLQE